MKMSNEKSYSCPLSIYFIWSPSDHNDAFPIIELFKDYFSRNVDKPFSRSVNLPMLFYSSPNGREVPQELPAPKSKAAILFVFTSVNTAGVDKWREYVESLKSSETVKIVPVALDNMGLNHQGGLEGINCIRAYEWESSRNLHGLIALSHEVLRHGFSKRENVAPGTEGSLKIFLSHSKHDEIGLSYVESVKKFIDNSSIRRFFDATEIAPGYKFSEEIEEHIRDSTIIAFVTDTYSSRYWCQKEILYAKKFERPVVIVNCLKEFEDRVFPDSSNVPCLTVDTGLKIDESNILKILSSSLTETIRFEHALKQLEVYQQIGWFSSDAYLMARPPEIRKMLELKNAGVTQVCYPEPPIYSDEADWQDSINIEAITPLWAEDQKDLLKVLKVGISISDRSESSYDKVHTHPEQLTKLSQSIARHLLSRSATLVYGGDLRKDGFTSFILDEAYVLSDRLKTLDIKIENHLAWPIHVEGTKIKAWRAQHHKLMKTIEHEIPQDVANGIATDLFLEPSTPENLYIWSRCLSQMRQHIVGDCDFRICAGGKASGYKGKMPGVLEEIMIALESDKPLFLLGGFDGIVGDICKLILNNDVPQTLTEDWQVANNAGYSELIKIAAENDTHCDYSRIVSTLRSVNTKALAEKTKLSEEEYKTLMVSPYIEECVHLILKSLKNHCELADA